MVRLVTIGGNPDIGNDACTRHVEQVYSAAGCKMQPVVVAAGAIPARGALPPTRPCPCQIAQRGTRSCEPLAHHRILSSLRRSRGGALRLPGLPPSPGSAPAGSAPPCEVPPGRR